MKIVSNNKLVRNRRRISQITTFTSLGILAIGLYLSFQSDLLTYSFICLIAGFLLSQVSIYYGNRWGRNPRQDELITQSLKGLDDKYTLYHYMVAIPHLLIGPSGIWVLLPFHQRGTIEYDTERNRWRQKGGNIYMKLFAQESLGRPEVETKNQLKDIQQFLEKEFADLELPDPKAVLVFTNEKAVIKADEAPYPTINAKKIKDFIRREAKQTKYPADSISLLQKTLPKESID